MASNTEMRRLILHSADRLAAESPNTFLADAIESVTSFDAIRTVTRQALSLTAAIELAEGTLRMVAACLAEDEPVDVRTPEGATK